MVTFFGTSPRSAKFLELAVNAGLKFDLVVSEPPKPTGRHQALSENPAIACSKIKGIPFLDELEKILLLPKPTLGIILDFNQIIPKKIINHFQKGIINIHFSRLPQYRGPAPVQYTILNSDKNAWITYYLISEKLDEGKVIFQTSLELDFKETTDSLYEKLIEKAAKEIPAIINDYLAEKITPQPQQGTPTYTQKLTSQNCQINWQKPPQEIERLIRAAYPEPGAWCLVSDKVTKGQSDKGKRLKILKAHLENNQLILDLVQLEGKNPVTWHQFKQGYPKAKLI